MQGAPRVLLDEAVAGAARDVRDAAHVQPAQSLQAGQRAEALVRQPQAAAQVQREQRHQQRLALAHQRLRARVRHPHAGAQVQRLQEPHVGGDEPQRGVPHLSAAEVQVAELVQTAEVGRQPGPHPDRGLHQFLEAGGLDAGGPAEDEGTEKRRAGRAEGADGGPGLGRQRQALQLRESRQQPGELPLGDVGAGEVQATGLAQHGAAQVRLLDVGAREVEGGPEAGVDAPAVPCLADLQAAGEIRWGEVRENFHPQPPLQAVRLPRRGQHLLRGRREGERPHNERLLQDAGVLLRGARDGALLLATRFAPLSSNPVERPHLVWGPAATATGRSMRV